MNAAFRYLALLLLLVSATGRAAGLTEAQVASLLPEGLRLGSKDARLPVWPVLRASVSGEEAVLGYVFQSNDLVRIAGYAGTPVNLLIVLDREGRFVQVRVVHHNEPVFVDGLGPEPLFRFVEQYAGKSIRDPIVVGNGRAVNPAGAAVRLDAVSRATVSVRIVNETVLRAALMVARAKLKDVGPLGTPLVRRDVREQASWSEMLARGWVARLRVTRLGVWLRFLGTGVDEFGLTGLLGGDDVFLELHYAYLNVPSIGIALLGEESFRRLTSDLQPGEHLLGVFSAGGHSFDGEDVVPLSVAERLSLEQRGRAIGVEALDRSFTPQLADMPAFDDFAVLRVDDPLGFDPSVPWALRLKLVRTIGGSGGGAVARTFSSDCELPSRFFAKAATAGESSWLAVWQERAWELGVVAGGLAVLSVALLRRRQRRLTADARRFARFRWLFLAFTLGYIGWSAQGQLSILNLVAVVQAARGGFDLSAYLYAPATVVLAAFVLVSLLVWGRGTYCGWLCPFGALQEFAAWVGARLRLPQVKPPEGLDRWLVRLKYLVLATILGAAVFSAETAERASEVEPFKTAISLAFVRDWPFVVYALLLVGASAFLFKAFCRYLCPLGAALAVLGRARRWDWLARRAECGRPCQRCRHRCRYNAIERGGAVRYEECFQCLDCVVIYHDRRKCWPLNLADRRSKRAAAAKCAS